MYQLIFKNYFRINNNMYFINTNSKKFTGGYSLISYISKLYINTLIFMVFLIIHMIQHMEN